MDGRMDRRMEVGEIRKPHKEKKARRGEIMGEVEVREVVTTLLSVCARWIGRDVGKNGDA